MEWAGYGLCSHYSQICLTFIVSKVFCGMQWLLLPGELVICCLCLALPVQTLLLWWLQNNISSTGSCNCCWWECHMTNQSRSGHLRLRCHPGMTILCTRCNNCIEKFHHVKGRNASSSLERLTLLQGAKNSLSSGHSNIPPLEWLRFLMHLWSKIPTKAYRYVCKSTGSISSIALKRCGVFRLLAIVNSRRVCFYHDL